LDELTRVVQRLCEAGANAIRRYIVASGQDVDDIQEYYLTSSLFDSVGCGRSATLETRFRDLHRWIGDRDNSRFPLEEDTKCKVDLVIYDGFYKHPTRQKARALVEVKKGSVDADNWDRN
jgi:hypothetical protein